MSDLHNKNSTRIIGWDLLRGICAVSICFYHLLSWTGIATLHAVGHYGVYLFFILSGASLALTYKDSVLEGNFSFRDFFFKRYLRIWPLYFTLLLVVLPWKIMHEETLLIFFSSL